MFFYARPVTPREEILNWECLLSMIMGKKNPRWKSFLPAGILVIMIPFPSKLKFSDSQVLAESYVHLDMCLIISNTNLSLLPLEVMACGSVAVCSRGENSTWLVNEENSVLVDYDPNQIAEIMEYYFKNPDKLDLIRKKRVGICKADILEKGSFKSAGSNP